MFLVVLLYAILSSTFFIAKKALMYSPPFFLIGTRMTLAGLILLGYIFFKSPKKLHIKKRDILMVFNVAFFHIYFSFMCEFWALQYLSALKTTLIYSATPFIAALLSFFILKERLSIIKIVGIIIGIGGLFPVLLVQAQEIEVSMELYNISIPEVVLFLAVISSAYAWFIVTDLIKRGYGLVVINGFAMLIGGIMSLCTTFIVEGFTCPISDFWPFIFWMLLLIFTANVVAFNFYGWLLTKYSITFLTFSGFLCPSFGTIYEWLFMKGTISWHYFASLICIALGLYIFYKDDLRLKTKFP
jgi:drug/metabolite transporter (DMT)-like permease